MTFEVPLYVIGRHTCTFRGRWKLRGRGIQNQERTLLMACGAMCMLPEPHALQPQAGESIECAAIMAITAATSLRRLVLMHMVFSRQVPEAAHRIILQHPHGMAICLSEGIQIFVDLPGCSRDARGDQVEKGVCLKTKGKSSMILLHYYSSFNVPY